jgi:hypothetical protein
MDPETLVAPGSLARALIPAAMERRLPSERPPVQNPAEVLANLMDFPGSVALAELLEALLASRGAAPTPASADGSEQGDALLRDAQLRLDSIEPQVLKPLLGRRAPELPSAPALLVLLQQYGIASEHAPERPSPEGTSASAAAATPSASERLAEQLGAPFHGALGLSLRQAQAHIATFRAELGPELRALGARAAELERLDATLTRSMQASVGQLLDRMEHAAQLTFARACAHAVANLPEQVGEAELAAWCASDGWLARYHERCVRMAKALFDHQRRGLEGLLRAAILSEES